MFLIMGINNGRKTLDFSQFLICPCCGRSGQIEIVKTFTYFMLFFIPLFRWNKRYFVTMKCCGASCELDSELGRAIEKGRIDHINEEDLKFSREYYSGNYSRADNYGKSSYPSGAGPISARANMSAASDATNFAHSYVDEDGLRRVKIKTCENCGYETGEDFAFCPKCGKPL